MTPPLNRTSPQIDAPPFLTIDPNAIPSLTQYTSEADKHTQIEAYPLVFRATAQIEAPGASI